MSVTADYERSIKGFMGSNIPYERIEADAKGIFYASRRKLYSARLGAGFYTMRGSHWYFIDYSNFNDNYIPGGWNDDWSAILLPVAEKLKVELAAYAIELGIFETGKDSDRKEAGAESIAPFGIGMQLFYQ